MQLNVFKNVIAAKPQEKDLDTIVNVIRGSEQLRDLTSLYREYMTGGKTQEAKRIKITKIPTCAPCGLLFEGKSRDDVVGLTDLCFLDIDHISDEQIATALEILRQDKHVVIATTSVSGKGLHIVIKYSIQGWQMPPQRIKIGTTKMQKLYKRIFDCITKEYEQKLGLKTDRQSGHIERLLILSYNPNIYYNPNAESIEIDIKANPARIIKA